MRSKWLMMAVVGVICLALAACGSGGGSKSGGSQSGGSAPSHNTSQPPSDSGSSGASSGTSSGESSPAASPAEELKWPEKNIRFVVPFAAGGGADVNARLIGPILERELGVSVVIENITGGGGWVGWSEVAASKPDGYTISYLNIPTAITGYLNPSANRKENLDSFEFIMNHVVDAGLLAVRPDDDRFPDIQAFVEFAKNNELIVNSSGAGSANHTSGAHMQNQLGVKFRYVQTDGTGEAIPNVLGGHFDALIAGLAETMEFLKSGQLKPLAVFGPDRVPELPDVPTLDEVFGVEIPKFISRGIIGPKGIDPAIVEKLQSAIEAAQNDPGHIEEIKKLGLEMDATKGQAYYEQSKAQEAAIIEMKSLFGW